VPCSAYREDDCSTAEYGRTRVPSRVGSRAPPSASPPASRLRGCVEVDVRLDELVAVPPRLEPPDVQVVRPATKDPDSGPLSTALGPDAYGSPVRPQRRVERGDASLMPSQPSLAEIARGRDAAARELGAGAPSASERVMLR